VLLIWTSTIPKPSLHGSTAASGAGFILTHRSARWCLWRRSLNNAAMGIARWGLKYARHLGGAGPRCVFSRLMSECPSPDRERRQNLPAVLFTLRNQPHKESSKGSKRNARLPKDLERQGHNNLSLACLRPFKHWNCQYNLGVQVRCYILWISHNKLYTYRNDCKGQKDCRQNGNYLHPRCVCRSRKDCFSWWHICEWY